jgi:N-acetylated-alpha-linked acidic dipeptidase
MLAPLWRVPAALIIALGALALEPQGSRAQDDAAPAAAPASPAAHSGAIQGPVTPRQLLGFSAESTARELALEQRFDARLDPQQLASWLRRLASDANNVGSPHDKANAQSMQQMLASWGWDARIETFYVLYPTPLHEALELIAPTHYTARLHEPAVAGDPTTAISDALPPYNVYGADGDVSGTLVYVNYGMPEDYEALARRQIDVRGKIVITRYGRGWRGLKPKLAYEHGAIGCIIYSDPREDGYAQGDTYPRGGWRPPGGVQRGSVGDITLYSGDPLTPGVGATRDAQRLSRAEAKTLLKIPVMPISYEDAQPLLAALTGPVAPEDWRGALPITYHIGPGAARVHLAIRSDWSLKPIYDVIATIRGEESPDAWVIRGNHHDGWVAGAWDPLSGMVAELAEAQAIGALVREGARPRRTLIYASWDAEEPGLLGSTEWVEQHAQELQSKAVLYVNTDDSGRGFLGAAGSHDLQHFMNEAAASVRDPETGASLQARERARILVDAYGPAAREEARRTATLVAGDHDLPIGALGSGSDFTPFLQHLGIASLAIEFGGEDAQGGVYHSLYDTFDHYARFGDPGFVYGIALAQTAGRLMLRMANAEVLPLEPRDFADTLERYRVEVHQLADERRRHAEDLDKLLDGHAFELTSDPRAPLAAPARAPAVPYLDFAPLDNAVARVRRAAAGYAQAYAQGVAEGRPLAADKRAALNDLLRGLEQTLTDEHGLSGREWYRHLIYAPGMFTGYGVKTLPGVREAIEQNHWSEAEQSIVATAHALDRYSERLERATAVIAG